MNKSPARRSDPAPSASAGGANPVLVEVTRGTAVESRHRGAVAVVDAEGATVAAWGEVGRPVYPRSAVKPLQALPLIETGAADAFAVSDAEIALACASHSGEPGHVEAVRAWLARLGLGPGDLECGAHPPSNEAAADALVRAGAQPETVHNNCSGKHTGMLATALHMGEPTAGYVTYDHPVQARVRAVLAEMTGCDIAAAPTGTDGCSIPTYAIPLDRLALGFARFARPDGLAPPRAAAIKRVQAAMAAHPFMIAGTGRFCTAAIEATRGAVLVKTGAEGVYAAAIPARGLGVALKIDDGAKRAAEVAIAAVLRYLGALDDTATAGLAPLAAPVLRNWRGIKVGQIRPAAGWLEP